MDGFDEQYVPTLNNEQTTEPQLLTQMINQLQQEPQEMPTYTQQAQITQQTHISQQLDDGTHPNTQYEET
eukprot:11992118-Prorocentrum_lima.AAC.1